LPVTARVMSRRPPSSPTAESCIAALVSNGVSRALILSRVVTASVVAGRDPIAPAASDIRHKPRHLFHCRKGHIRFVALGLLSLQSVEPDLWANVGIDCVREPNQTATPKAVKLRFITAVEQNMAELGHAPPDESALEQTELCARYQNCLATPLQWLHTFASRRLRHGATVAVDHGNIHRRPLLWVKSGHCTVSGRCPLCGKRRHYSFGSIASLSNLSWRRRPASISIRRTSAGPLAKASVARSGRSGCKTMRQRMDMPTNQITSAASCLGAPNKNIHERCGYGT
jgi:hypothetical protein